MVPVVYHENFITLGAILPLPTSALYLNKYEKNGSFIMTTFSCLANYSQMILAGDKKLASFESFFDEDNDFFYLIFQNPSRNMAFGTLGRNKVYQLSCCL